MAENCGLTLTRVPCPSGANVTATRACRAWGDCQELRGGPSSWSQEIRTRLQSAQSCEAEPRAVARTPVGVVSGVRPRSRTAVTTLWRTWSTGAATVFVVGTGGAAGAVAQAARSRRAAGA